MHRIITYQNPVVLLNFVPLHLSANMNRYE
ncbi:MAG: hypothetical protein PWQ06_1821, partial [Anaerophaga sp.]|nr:hypothetical protein [Anaerophaga sp.]